WMALHYLLYPLQYLKQTHPLPPYHPASCAISIWLLPQYFLLIGAILNLPNSYITFYGVKIRNNNFKAYGAITQTDKCVFSTFNQTYPAQFHILQLFYTLPDSCLYKAGDFPI